MRGLVRTGGGGTAKETELFTPSSYTGITATSDTGTAFALADGATKLKLTNLNATIVEYGVLAYGTSAANAQANLAITANVAKAGIIIPTTDITGSPMGETITAGVPALATHAALGHSVAGANNDIMVTQGV